MFNQIINPVLFSIFGLEIRYYGLIYLLSFILIYSYLKYIIKKDLIKGLNIENLDSLFLYLVLGVVLGARLGFFLFNYPLTFIQNPIQVIRIWEGGMSFHGGLIGVIISGYIFSRKYNVSFLKLGDFLVIPAAVALGFGRITNFLNNELYGIKSNIQWCVNFKDVEGCRHPYQIYSSLSHFLTAGILYYANKIKELKEGALFFLFIFLYGLFRFLIDFYRDEAEMIFGISGGQLLSLVMFVIGLWFLIKKR